MTEGDLGEHEVTIVIADDHQIVRAGLRLLLEAEPGFRVVAEAGDMATAERRVTAYRPEVLIVPTAGAIAHVTPAASAPSSIARNCNCPPEATNALAGATLS